MQENQENQENQEIQEVKKINGLTFLEFMNEFKGKRIFDRNEKEVPKFLLFWSGKTITQIKKTHTLIDRI